MQIEDGAIGMGVDAPEYKDVKIIVNDRDYEDEYGRVKSIIGLAKFIARFTKQEISE